MPRIDNDIAIKIKNGNITAFNQLFDAIYLQLYFHCRKYIADSDEAKDVLQNVFLRFWEKREEINIHTSLNNYLFRAVHNECLNVLRDAKTGRVISSNEIYNESNQMFEFEDQFNDPDSEFATEEIEKIISDAIKQLPTQCQIIFSLSRIDGLSNKEIAKKQNLSIRTVETQIYRALKLVRIYLKDYWAH